MFLSPMGVLHVYIRIELSPTTPGTSASTLYNKPSTFSLSLLYLTAVVNDQLMKMMIDTGANRTFIPSKALNLTYNKQFVNRSHRRVFLVDGLTSLFIYGEIKLHIRMGDVTTYIY